MRRSTRHVTEAQDYDARDDCLFRFSGSEIIVSVKDVAAVVYAGGRCC